MWRHCNGVDVEVHVCVLAVARCCDQCILNRVAARILHWRIWLMEDRGEYHMGLEM